VSAEAAAEWRPTVLGVVECCQHRVAERCEDGHVDHKVDEHVAGDLRHEAHDEVSEQHQRSYKSHPAYVASDHRGIIAERRASSKEGGRTAMGGTASAPGHLTTPGLRNSLHETSGAAPALTRHGR